MAWGDSKLDRWFLSISGGIVLLALGLIGWVFDFPNLLVTGILIVLGAVIIIKNLIEKFKK